MYTQTDYTQIIAVYLVLAIVVGLLARSRGNGFFGYFLVSALLSPVIGFIVLMVAKPANRAPCWQCKEMVIRGATKCPHCGAELTWPESHAPAP